MLKLSDVRVFRRLLILGLLVAPVGGAAWLHWRGATPAPYGLAALRPSASFSRPYGMAPAAFDGFKRACYRARVHPYRIGQTIGDHPRSVGYHHRDGKVRYRGQKLDYTAAVDIGTADLTRAQIGRLLEGLASQGFAAFYREKGHWQGNEHIHAVYAPLKMKPQLRAQLLEWAAKRRRQGKRVYRWQRRRGLH